MMGPSYQLRSSDPNIMVIDGNISESVGWAKAVAPGKANIEYIHHHGQFTPVIITR
jgi:hypothetical protein